MAAVGFFWACLCLCGAHMCGEDRLVKARNLLFTCALPSRCECPDGNFEAQISDWGDVGDRKTAGKEHFFRWEKCAGRVMWGHWYSILRPGDKGHILKFSYGFQLEFSAMVRLLSSLVVACRRR